MGCQKAAIALLSASIKQQAVRQPQKNPLIVEGVKKTFQPCWHGSWQCQHTAVLFATGFSWERFVLFRAQSSDRKQREAGLALECSPKCCI